jgi:hypothetical protein
MAVYYASTTDWALFIGPVTDAAAVAKLIERAEDDIDAYVGPYTLESNGRKFGAPKSTNEKYLTAVQKTALAKATCLQGDYRARLFPGGEDGIDGANGAGVFSSVSGPDFSYTYAGNGSGGSARPARVSPRAKPLLASAGLLVRSASLR